jgi:Predicted membrane protein
MSSENKLVSLTKYIMTLPPTRISLFSMVFLSFIIGCIAFLMEPSTGDSILYNIVYGGSTGFLIFGLMSIMGGGLTQPMVNSFKGRHMKMKQSMFLALLSMLIVGVIYLIGSVVSVFTVNNYVLNALIFGCVIVFAFRTLVVWGTSNISLIKSIVIAIVQPALILSMVVVITFLTSVTTNMGNFSIIAIVVKIVIASIILVIAIYSFVTVIESPMRKNLGVGGLELLSLALAHITEGSPAMETLFEDIGEPIDTLTGIFSFKGKNGIKAIFLSPCVHPGPLGNIGGGNMPTILSNKFDVFTMVSHGPSTHDFNPVASKEISKIEKVVKEALEDMDYSESASKFFRVENEGAVIGAQYFDKNLLMLATFAPAGFDDIDFGVGLALMNLAKASCDVQNVVLVDCHNSFKGEGGRVLPGNKEVFELMGAVEKLKSPEQEKGIRVGCSSDPMDDISKEDGVGQSGVKVMVIEVGTQKTAYILLDSNNMIIGFRDVILERIKTLGLDYAEVMTTDTHFVNTMSGGHNPVGTKLQDEIIAAILRCTQEALNDMEDVSVGCKVANIEDIKTFGPLNATELVTTISSIVAVSRIFAPLVFLLALLFVFIWIFYGTFGISGW